MLNKEKMKEIFDHNNLPFARMISHSKSNYIQLYPYNNIYFNANIYIQTDNLPLKIWYGDLDITFDGYILKKIANQIDKTLYICKEHTVINNNEDFNQSNIWNTEMNIIDVTPEYIQKCKNKELEDKRIYRIKTLQNIKKEMKINKQFSIIDLINVENTEKPYLFSKKIDIPYDLLEEKLENFKKEFYHFKKSPNRNKGRLYNKYFKNYGYFSYGILDQYLSNLFKITKDYRINPSAIWLSRYSNKKIKKIDLEIEQLFNPNFKYTDFHREVTCNYCIPYIQYLNHDNINIKSYEDDVFYIDESRLLYKKMKNFY